MLLYNNTILNTKLDNMLINYNLDFKFKSDLLYIIYHLRTYPFKSRDYSPSDFIPIKLQYLRNLITYDKTKYFLDILVSEGVLSCDNKYIVGEKAKGYKIADKYRSQKFYLEEMVNKRLSEKIQKVLQQFKNNILEKDDSYAYVTNCMEDLEIDTIEALKILKGIRLPKDTKSSLQTMLERFDDKFAVVDDIGNRLHNNLTNIATVLRKTLTYKGNKLVQCDLKNSQPLFFRIYLNKYPLIPQSELDKYLDVVCNIGFYEFFAEKLKMKLTDGNRGDFKKKIFGGVLFDRNRKVLSKYEKVFKEEFPLIFHCMRDMKKEDYKNIPISLQKLESQFIFHCVDVLRDIHKGIELLTIHDSICTVDGKETVVYDVMMEEFYNMFGILPKIKVEKFA